MPDEMNNDGLSNRLGKHIRPEITAIILWHSFKNDHQTGTIMLSERFTLNNTRGHRNFEEVDFIMYNGGCNWIGSGFCCDNC